MIGTEGGGVGRDDFIQMWMQTLHLALRRKAELPCGREGGGGSKLQLSPVCAPVVKNLRKPQLQENIEN